MRAQLAELFQVIDNHNCERSWLSIERVANNLGYDHFCALLASEGYTISKVYETGSVWEISGDVAEMLQTDHIGVWKLQSQIVVEC
jgi:hypothetical protein